MGLLIKFFEMHNHGQVIFRTLWSSLVLAVFTVFVATNLWAILAPASSVSLITEIRTITFILTLLIAAPVFFALYFMSLQITRKNDALLQLANLDPLTGIYNRRALSERFAFLSRKARRAHETGTFLVIDVDNFKLINDKFGHDIGDQVLIHLSTSLRALCGPDACFARLGGEEFAVVRFGITPKQASDFAEKIRTGIETTPLETDSQEIAFTVSIGYCLVEEGDTLNSVLRYADSALYTAKRTGRNRVFQYVQTASGLAPHASNLLQTAPKVDASQSASSK